MSDPIARPHKRMATLVGAGIAAMLSPSGKIISSAAAASLIVAAVATQVLDGQNPTTVQMNTPSEKQSSALPVSHVEIETGGGEVIPVMMSESVTAESGVTPIEVGGTFTSGVTINAPGSGSGGTAASAPLTTAAPASGGSLPQFTRPGLPDGESFDPEILATPLVSDPDAENAKEDATGDPDTSSQDGSPQDTTPGGKDKTPVLASEYPPRIAEAAPDKEKDDLPESTSPLTQLTPFAVVAEVPEPGMIGLVLLGLGGLAVTAHRRRQPN